MAGSFEPKLAETPKTLASNHCVEHTDILNEPAVVAVSIIRPSRLPKHATHESQWPIGL